MRRIVTDASHGCNVGIALPGCPIAPHRRPLDQPQASRSVVTIALVRRDPRPPTQVALM